MKEYYPFNVHEPFLDFLKGAPGPEGPPGPPGPEGPTGPAGGVNDMVNGIKFSKDWTAYPDDKADGSELANDVSTFKKLMIVGNKSGGAERRVGIWDSLWVHGYGGVDANWHINNDLILDGTNKWIFHTPNDGRKQMYVAPMEGDAWKWDKGIEYHPAWTHFHGGAYIRDNLHINNDVILDGDNKWIFHTPNDGRKQMYIAPWGTNDWNWDKQIRVEPNGDLMLNNSKLCVKSWCFEEGADGKLYVKKNNAVKQTFG